MSAMRCASAIAGASSASAGKNASHTVGTPPLTPAASEPCSDRCSAPSAVSAARAAAPSSVALVFVLTENSASPPPSAPPPIAESLVPALRERDSHVSADAAIARLCAPSISAQDAAGGISVTVSPVTSRRARKPGNRPATRDVTRRRHCARSARAAGEAVATVATVALAAVALAASSRVNGASCTNARAVGNQPPWGTNPSARSSLASSSSSRTSGSVRDPEPETSLPTSPLSASGASSGASFSLRGA